MRRTCRALAALTLTAALLAPAAARADDATFSAVAKAGIPTVAAKERAASSAVKSVSTRSDVPKAKQALGDARSTIKAFVKKLQGKNPSSADGKKAKDLLVTALQSEDRAYGQIANGLDALREGRQSAATSLLKKAKANLEKATAKAKTAGMLIAGLTPAA